MNITTITLTSSIKNSFKLANKTVNGSNMIGESGM